MMTLLVHWVRFVIVISLFLSGFSWSKKTLENNLADISIYMPMVSNFPAGMAYVPAGEFLMGCPSGFCNFGSGYIHNVYINEFFMDNYEITNAQYAKCVTTGFCAPPGAFGSHTRSSYYDDPGYSNYPVIHISWDDANDYCAWVGKRLPTEAEWEKASQGGRDAGIYHYPWGIEDPVCNLGAPNGAQYDECSPDDTIEIGSFGPNNIGLYDMGGNVWEWVSDWYDLSYYSNSPYYNPQGPDTGTEKVIRGGSWNYNSTGLQVFDRNFRDPNNLLGNHDVGFRCVFIP